MAKLHPVEEFQISQANRTAIRDKNKPVKTFFEALAHMYHPIVHGNVLKMQFEKLAAESNVPTNQRNAFVNEKLTDYAAFYNQYKANK